MKLSIFTTVTDPTRRGDNWWDAFDCYKALADELIIIDGTKGAGVQHWQNYNENKTMMNLPWEWPQDFSWEFIGQQFQRGYEASSGDWVIHADIDFIFHEKDFDQIRKSMEENPKAPALSFWKYQFILPDRYNLKSRLVVAVNKKVYGDRIRFDSGGDLCQPSLDGEEIKPDYVEEAKVPIYNYEKLLKTVPQVEDDVWRMARAWERYFGEPKLGSDPEEAFNEWMIMVRGRFNKPQKKIDITEHPIFVQNTLKTLRPYNWGYSGFGLLGRNKYVEDSLHSR